MVKIDQIDAGLRLRGTQDTSRFVNFGIGGTYGATGISQENGLNQNEHIWMSGILKSTKFSLWDGVWILNMPS